MVTPPEVLVLAVVFAAVLVIYLVLKAIKPLLINAILGILVLIAASAIGYGVNVTLVILLIVAIGGIPGAILVLLLAHLDILFEPALVIVGLAA